MEKPTFELKKPDEQEEKRKQEIEDKFRKDLQKYADKNGYQITSINGWTDKKIRWMAHNERKCCCAPDTRKCPCREGIAEIQHKGKCKCSILERKY